MSPAYNQPSKNPVKVGIIGTGYAAIKRVETFQASPRAQVLAIAGNTPERTSAAARTHGIDVSPSWQALIERDDLDLVVVCHVNSEHGAAVHRTLTAGKSVVVEYPLALSVSEATASIALAKQQNLLLHVEHIELLGSLHQAMQTHLADIGTPAYVRYCTVVPQPSAPQKWTYHTGLFGFPLIGALSRIHRLINLFGAVQQVFCQLQYSGMAAESQAGYFKNCRCTAHLKFQAGVIAEVLYAKGEQTWTAQRWMAVEGDRGALVFDGDLGNLILPEETRPIQLGTRRGLFAQDTAAVLDALWEGKPLYVTPTESLYALQVAAAAEQSAHSGTSVTVPPPPQDHPLNQGQ